MDPDATLREFLDAVEAGDVDRVQELSDALNGWTARGGYPPRTLGSPTLGTIWHLAVTKAVIRLGKDHVRIVADHKGESDVAP